MKRVFKIYKFGLFAIIRPSIEGNFALYRSKWRNNESHICTRDIVIKTPWKCVILWVEEV